MIEDVGDDIYEPPDSDFSRATMRLFYEIDDGKAGLLPSSNFGEGEVGSHLIHCPKSRQSMLVVQ